MFIVTITYLLAWSLSGRDTTLAVALSYVALYAVYVALVFGQDWYERRGAQRKAHRSRVGSLGQELGELGELGAPGSVEAFWGESSAEAEAGAGAGPEPEPVRHEQGLLRQPLLQAPREEIVASVAGVAGDAGDAGHMASAASAASASSAAGSAGQDGARHSPEIIDDYHTSERVESSEVQSSSPDLPRRRASSAMSTFFWKKQSWRARARAHAALQLRSLRSLTWLEASSLVACVPLDLARRATIPSLEREQWFKPLAVMQPVLCAGFLLFVSGAAGRSRAAAPLVLVPSALASAALQLVLQNSRPPQGVVAGVALALAFACSVGWIFFAANELVALLNTLGHIVGANPSVLGLTVLAMGNSAGDLVANTAIARAGMPTMAIAACFGAPLLNILLGLGLSMTILVVSKAPEPVLVKLDRHSVAIAACLLGTLSLILLAAAGNRFQMPLWLPNALLLVYAAYIALSIALLWVGASPA
jgi:Ca2+/Na+ antiporter